MTDTDDKDHVFARFQEGPATPSDRREQRVIPRRGTASGTRVVEVVRVRSGGALKEDRRLQSRTPLGVRAATWEDGFPAREAARDRIPVDVPTAEPAQPAVHVMPMWEHTGSQEGPSSPPDRTPRNGARRAAATNTNLRTTTVKRHVANPFDAGDDGANCLHCGYAIEPERDRQGLMTCIACG